MSYTLKYKKKVKQSASRIDSPTHWNTKRKWNNLHLELTSYTLKYKKKVKILHLEMSYTLKYKKWNTKRKWNNVHLELNWNTKRKWNNLHLELTSYTLKYKKKVKQSSSRIDVLHTEIQKESETILTSRIDLVLHTEIQKESTSRIDVLHTEIQKESEIIFI